MKLLYDHQTFTQQKYGGISRYFCELIDQFSHDPDFTCTLALRYSWNENLQNRPSLDANWSRKNKFLSGRIFPYIWQISHFDLFDRLGVNKRESVRLLKKQDFDLFHPTYYDPYFLRYLIKKPFVLTVHDMIHEIFPQYFRKTDRTSLHKKRLIEASSAIIAVSQHTKDDILKFYNIPSEKIHVIYHGSPALHSSGSEKYPLNEGFRFPTGRFLLYVGTRSGYKNFDFMIRALSPCIMKQNDLSLICCGGGSFSTSEIKKLQDLQISDKCLYVPGNDQNLLNLYTHASALIIPSLYEGFGIPVLEAYSCGCPVLISNTSSLPEVGGDAAKYFDPTDVHSIVAAVENLLSSGDRREELIWKGYRQLEKFSWERTAEQTKKVYEEVLG